MNMAITPSSRLGRGPLWLAVALLMALLLAMPAFAQTFPKLSGRVVDDAHLLSPEQTASLTTKLEALEKQSGRQMVIATVPSLEGYDISYYGYRLGREWKIGEAKVNSGLLLLVAPNERKVRIEVGYGLEPIVTDALSSVIIQRQIIPHFQQGDMAGGIVAGTDALLQLLQLPPDQAQAKAQQMVAADKKARSSGGGVPIALIFWIMVIIFIALSSLRRAGGRRYRSGGIPPVIIWPSSGGGWGGGSGGGGWGGGGGGGGFSGGGGSFGGGGSSGSW